MRRPLRERPRARSFIGYDRNNAYERLGVSPLASTGEIAARLFERRQEAAREAKATEDESFGEEMEAVLKVDEIANAIQDPAKRQQYDEDNPQNVLLTVQSSLVERFRQPYRRAGLVSEWLRERLGPDLFLPSTSAVRLWHLNSVTPTIQEFLADYPDLHAAPDMVTNTRSPSLETADLWHQEETEMASPDALNSLLDANGTEDTTANK